MAVRASARIPRPLQYDPRILGAASLRADHRHSRDGGDRARVAGGPAVYRQLLLAFSLAALVLAIAGVYGVMSYFVAQRTHEIGIRMAVGATAGRVQWLVLRQGAVIVGAGLLAGLLGAFGAAQALAHVLYGVDAEEPQVYLVTASILGVTAVLASIGGTARDAYILPSPAI